MFSWFKSKVELKNEKWIMSSVDNKHGLKFGSEIVVPDNFECLIYYKGKYFSSLSSGKHKLEKTTFEHLVKSQQKNKSKIKRVSFISHFVSLLNQQVEFKYKNTKYIVNFCITDTIKFADLMLLYSYKVDNSYTYSYLAEIFTELLIHNNKNHTKINSDALKEFGISITSFAPNNSKVSIFSVESPTNKPQSQNIDTSETRFDTANKTNAQQNETSNQNSTSTTTEVAVNSKTVNFPKCPKCGNVTRFATTYCLKCGHKFE